MFNLSPLAKMLKDRKKYNIVFDPENIDTGYDDQTIDEFHPDDEYSNRDVEPIPAKKKSSLFDSYKALTSQPQKWTDEYTKTASTPPTKDQYQPSKMRRLAAILGGAATGYQTRDVGKAWNIAEGINDQPFNEAESKYTKKLTNLKSLAGMEQDKLRRDIEGIKYSEADRDFDFNTTKETNDQKNADRNYNLNITQSNQAAERIKLEKERLDKEGWAKTSDSDGNVTYTNPSHPGQVITFKGADRNINQEDKNQHSNRLGEIKETGEQARTTEETRQTGRLATIEARDKNKVDTARRILADKIAMEPDKILKSRYVAIDTAIAEDPELQEYIEEDPNTRALKPKMPFWGGDKAKYEKVKQILSATSSTSATGRGGFGAPIQR